MSSPSLRYPLKPPEVSDDMESFIYTIYFNTVRYHEHNMTKFPPDGVDSKAAPRNGKLVVWRWKYFFEEYARASSQGTFYVGGQEKHQSNNEKEVPFQLADQSTRFWAVIRWLQVFLAQHTVSLDENKLKQYSLSTFGVVPQSAQTPRVPGVIIEDFDTSTLYKPQKDPLADHALLFTLLNNAIEYDPEEWRRGDKIFDQFDNLPEVIMINGLNNSVAWPQPRDAKRKRTTPGVDEELVESAQGRPARTARTTRTARGNKKQKK